MLASSIWYGPLAGGELRAEGIELLEQLGAFGIVDRLALRQRRRAPAAPTRRRSKTAAAASVTDDVALDHGRRDGHVAVHGQVVHGNRIIDVLPDGIGHDPGAPEGVNHVRCGERGVVAPDHALAELDLEGVGAAGGRGGAAIGGRGGAQAGALDEAPLGGEQRQPLVVGPEVHAQRRADQLAVDGAVGQDAIGDEGVEVSTGARLEVRVGAVVFRAAILVGDDTSTAECCSTSGGRSGRPARQNGGAERGGSGAHQAAA